MTEPLKITEEMKNDRQERIDKIIDRQNKRIQQAVADGMHECIFYPDKNDAEYAVVRAKFESAGYQIKPTGYIGGVWQRTEDICW